MEIVGILLNAATCLFKWGKTHAAYVYKLKENLESLEEKRGDLDRRGTDVLRNIENEERMGDRRRTEEVEAWLEKVVHLQTEMKDIHAQGSQETRNRCLRGCCPKNCVSAYKLGKKVDKALKDMDNVLNHGNRFDSIDICINLPPKPVDEMPSVETIGMDSMLDKVWSNLEDENVGIIGLYGMGGVGKTTLMKRIQNELGRREHGFDLVLWVVASRECDINKIMNDIRNRLGIKDDSWKEMSQDERVGKIYQLLKQKKFVLMLDDLWEKLELEMVVGVPLPKGANCQSKVLFTTRSIDVCAKMQAQKKFKMECLLEKEAFDLFCQNVGEETLKCHIEIPKLAREMAEECRGLPLALVTVGSAMAGVDSVDAWREAKSDLTRSPSIASHLEEKVFASLKFSYDRLPDETHKKCFLYCALYPEDYEIVVDNLVLRWIGEGFLGNNKTKSSLYKMYEKGKSIIAKLKLSSLLEDAKNENRMCTWECAIKMHDVIRDTALWLARDEVGKKDRVVIEGEALALAMSEMDFEILNVVERISIINAKGSWKVPACPNLLSLCVRQSDVLKITDYSNLQCMTRLKVLDLSADPDRNFYYLPPEIGKLINLEFLCLSGMTSTKMLPIELKNLKKLRIFLMEEVEVPYGIRKMLSEVIESFERLKVFRFSAAIFSFDSEEAPLIEKLESLQELEELGMHLETVIGMQKLLNSTKLWDCVRYILLQHITEPLEMASLLESLSRMKQLERIHLSKMPGLMEGSSIAYNCHIRNLREVNIGHCHSITHLTWLKYAPLLEYLNLWGCESMEEVVKGCEDEDRDNSSHVFSNLKRLVLGDLPKLKSIHNRALPFPSLKDIEISNCPNLRKLPFNSNSAKDTLIVIFGELDWWNDLEWEDPAIKDSLRSKFQELKM